MKKHPIQNEDQPQISLGDFGISVPEIESLPMLPSATKGTAASLKIRYKDFGALTLADFEVFSRLPEHPLWSQVDRLVDFSFANELCAHLYSPIGQRPYAPALKLKLHLVQAMENLSDREIEVRLMFDIAIKRFVGVPLSFTGFDHSTMGLNRDRMGDQLFHACFHYVLAQAKARGLWGTKDDCWLVDSFHTEAFATRGSVRRLVQQGILRILQHLKRTNTSLFHSLMDTLSCQGWFERTAHDATPEEHLSAFSLLVARAYSLLSWFEHGSAHTLFWQWENKKQQLHSLELQALLCLILEQNTRQTNTGDSSSGTTSYEKIPKKQRPSDRIVNAYDPELRNGYKSSKLAFTGDKIQVAESNASGFILEIEPIPGNEHDGERLKALVTSVIEHHEVTPKLVSADSAYGYGHYRARLIDAGFELIAPIIPVINPAGLLHKDEFTYDEKRNLITCPQGKTTARIARNNKEEGYQYFFKTTDCAACPIQVQCTTNKKGRAIFISDHHKLVEAAKIRNETEEGQTARRVRSKIERTNNELANHHELRRPHVRGRNKLRIMAKLKAMVINIKLIVKKLGHYHEDPFVRQKLRPRGIAACTS